MFTFTLLIRIVYSITRYTLLNIILFRSCLWSSALSRLLLYFRCFLTSVSLTFHLTQFLVSLHRLICHCLYVCVPDHIYHEDSTGLHLQSSVPWGFRTDRDRLRCHLQSRSIQGSLRPQWWCNHGLTTRTLVSGLRKHFSGFQSIVFNTRFSKLVPNCSLRKFKNIGLVIVSVVATRRNP